MKRIPNRDRFSASAVKAVLEISEGTLYEMIRTGEIWEPSLDERGRNVWSFDAVAECCFRQIDRWLEEDVLSSLQNVPARRCPHSREELESLRSWIAKQVFRRRRFGSPDEAMEWEVTSREAERHLSFLQSMEEHNKRQRIGSFFGWLREEGKRECGLAGLEPFGPAPREDDEDDG